MAHTLMVNLTDDAYAELVRSAGKCSQSPELIAEHMLNEVLPDPLLRLSGCVDSSVADLTARLDEYLGESIQTHHS